MEEPQTPNRAVSEGPCPPRNSMEDADSSVTRKRPRLDSGNRTYRSMSTDKIDSAQALPELDQPLPNTDGKVYEPISTVSPDSTNQHSLSGTPSKVTINVRDKLLEDSSPNHKLAAELAAMGSDKTVHSTPAISAVNIASNSPNDVVVLSSPTRSPEIEVAEIEDMDDDPRQTRWKPMVSTTKIEDLQAALLENFPFAEKYTDLRECILCLAQTLEKGTHRIGLNSLAAKFMKVTPKAGVYSSILPSGSRPTWNRRRRILRTGGPYIYKQKNSGMSYLLPWKHSCVDSMKKKSAVLRIIGLILCNRTRPEKNFFQQEGDQHSERYKCIQDLLVAYTALVARMIQTDCTNLDDEDAKFVPDLTSAPYLKAMTWIVYSSPNVLAIWKLLDEGCKYDPRPAIAASIDRFFQELSQGARTFSRYIYLITNRSKTQVNYHYCVGTSIEILNHLTQFGLRLRDPMYPTSTAQTIRRAPNPSEIIKVFQHVDEKLQTFVCKQVPTLSSEICKHIIFNMAALLPSLLSADSELIARNLPRDFNNPSDITRDHQIYLITYVWKYRLLKKCIKQGRMEIRVQGVEIMQHDLVQAYSSYIRSSKTPRVVQYLSGLIVEDKLVDYLVGVDSHPNLIARSTNIVGFLVVADKYTEAETDVIWKTVAESQDKRTIDAVLDMVGGYLNISPYPVLLYLCEKLNQLPVEAFDPHMLHYCRAVSEQLGSKWKDMPLQKLGMSPYNLCIRLIRQAYAVTSLPLARKREICQFALAELHKLLNWAPSDVDRSSIYQECIADISTKSPYTTGSIAAINALLGSSAKEDIESLASKFNITSLIISEFAYLVSSPTIRMANFQLHSEPLTVRLNLLQQVIVHIPDSITSELGDILWNSMLGVQAPSEQARDAAWSMLDRAARVSLTPNSFLDRCVQDYLPNAGSQCLTLGVLPFAEQVVQYETRTSTQASSNESGQKHVPGSDLLWHISLSALNPHLGEKAVNLLVFQYLGSPSIRSASQDTVNETHIKLVEQCIRQLNIASTKLSRMNDGTSSGEEDSMVIIASEKETAKEKVYFIRSLQVLKEFIQGVRSRTLLSPSPRLLQRKVPNFQGARVCLRYQPFSGASNRSIQTIEVGDLETLGDLAAHIKSLTGFSKFTAIQGGQKLDLVNGNDSTIRDLKIDQKGLLLIRKTPDATPMEGSRTAQRLRPLEVEVMKYFPELYDLLGTEEMLAKDVSTASPCIFNN